MIVHKSDMLVHGGKGGKDKKVSFIGVLENKTMITPDKDGIDPLSMEVLIMGRTCFDVVGPFGS